MTLIYALLLIGAAVCFGIAAFVRRTGDAGRPVLVPLGLLLWVLVPLLQTLQGLDD